MKKRLGIFSTQNIKVIRSSYIVSTKAAHINIQVFSTVDLGEPNHCHNDLKEIKKMSQTQAR